MCKLCMMRLSHFILHASPCVHPLDTAMHVVSKHIKKESAAAHSKV